MAKTSKKAAGRRRSLPREVRRQQLIRATIDSIAKNGWWLDLLVTPQRYSRSKAKQVAAHYLASAFPQHMPLAATPSI